jgi:8-oxo-dGTP diphosphatase
MAIKKKRPPWLAVVAGILRKKNLVLLGQRPEYKSLPGMWEFPGGKIELGELPEEALKRELKEELGIDAEIGPLRIATTHDYKGLGVVLLFYEVNFWKGSPKAQHHLELKWVKASDLHQTLLPAANQRVLSEIIKVLST